MLVGSLGQEDPLEKDMAIMPVFLPGESHGQRSLAGYSPWGHKQLDTSEATGHISTYYEINKVGDGELGRASALEEVQIEDT